MGNVDIIVGSVVGGVVLLLLILMIWKFDSIKNWYYLKCGP